MSPHIQFEESVGTLEMKAITLLDRAMRFVVRAPTLGKDTLLLSKFPVFILTLPIPAPAGEVLYLYESIKKLKASAKQVFATPAFTRSGVGRSRALFRTTSKAAISLLALTAEIHCTHIKSTDGVYMLYEDEDAALKDRLDAAHACVTVIAVALDEIKAISASVPAGERQIGIEQTCFTIGVSLLTPLHGRGLFRTKPVSIAALDVPSERTPGGSGSNQVQD